MLHETRPPKSYSLFSSSRSCNGLASRHKSTLPPSPPGHRATPARRARRARTPGQLQLGMHSPFTHSSHVPDAGGSAAPAGPTSGPDRSDRVCTSEPGNPPDAVIDCPGPPLTHGAQRTRPPFPSQDIPQSPASASAASRRSARLSSFVACRYHTAFLQCCSAAVLQCRAQSVRPVCSVRASSRVFQSSHFSHFSLSSGPAAQWPSGQRKELPKKSPLAARR